MSLLWYINRLRTFSAYEIVFRIQQRFQTHVLDKRAVVQNKVTHPLPKSEIIENDKAHLPYPVFETTLDIYKPIDWHLDVSSSKRFPLLFSHEINIRSDKYGSAKHVWEVNRLLYLTRLAVSFKETSDPSLLALFQYHVTSWVNENPYLEGVNWYSNIEVNIRLINWYFCWKLLGVDSLQKDNPSFKNFVDSIWIPSIYNHCQYSFKHPSKHSSANNHLISEYAGLFVASSLWQFEESHSWNRYAKKGLEREIHIQNNMEGVNREEAAEYIQFIDDFFLIAAVVGEKHQKQFSDNYKAQLKKMFDYILAFLDAELNYPMYGDGDDGFCLRLDEETHFNNFSSLLTSAAIFFEDGSYKLKGTGFDKKNRMLFGEEGLKKWEKLPWDNSERSSKFFTNAGHFLFRKQVGNKEIYLHFDAAPLGFLSIAAHGHADALSFLLHVNGSPVLIDSGTFTYHTHPTWRHYFMGTLAHNTVRINEHDQAKIAGPTMWLSHNKASVLDYELGKEKEFVTASQDGYEKEGVTHTRTCEFFRSENTFIITDKITTSKETIIEIPFHLHPDKSYQLTSNVANVLLKDGTSVQLTLDKQLEYNVLKGQVKPILGWYSEHFGTKTACEVLYAKHKIHSNATFITKIQVLFND